ncbi:PBSX family phage terminase large subunit [Amycolatopsis sp. BJA-103]|uniref:PBSX family phage terminase large subunit n=1 Tax=Amycolatopsis sp. BJA-103 TaxID=1911175 RepID=UPI000C763105|nr:phage terminase large subunit [Amycolatopsis sp. BJA-103]AUI56797.1 terminase [Amycolatopsis sp. BJA-103]PNE13440.1 terminase [Amycolatopsis sp. BJA-103]
MTTTTAKAAALSVKQQDSILDATHRINIWEGAIRSGKTIGSIVRWLMYVRTAPAGPLAMIGKTRDTLARNVLDVIADMNPAAISYTRGATTARILGRLVHVIGANDARAESRIRGLTLAGAYVDEITVVPEAFFTQLLGRMSVPGAKLFGTTNPDTPTHWLNKNFLKKERLPLDDPDRPDLISFHFNLDDNPGLDREYVRGLMAEFTGLWFDRFILGKWVAAEGAIYQMLDEAKHTARAPDPRMWRRGWIALDYGTSNPTHALLIVLTAPVIEGSRIVVPERLHVVSEWRHDGRAAGQLTDAQISRKLAEWAAPLIEHLPDAPATILDPSAASLRVQMRSDGWPGLRAADNRVDVGIRAQASLISGGRFVIDHEACPHLWDEMCGYVWDDAALERGEEKPVKTDDHGPDAGRYGVMAARPIWRQWLPDLATSSELPNAA